MKTSTNLISSCVLIIFLLAVTEGRGQSPTNGGFENGTTSWTTVGSAGTTNARTGTNALAHTTSSTSNVAHTNSTTISIPNNSYAHVIGWAIGNSANSRASCGGTLNVIAGSAAITTIGTTLTRLTYPIQNTSGSAQNFSCRVNTRSVTGSVTVYWDDVIMYASTSNTTDIVDPVAPTSFTNGTITSGSVQFTWTNGSDAATGIQNTIILRTTNTSAGTPVMNDQGVYSTSGGTSGPNTVSTDWTVISTTVASGTSTYTDNSVSQSSSYKYAVNHRDMAYNYSTALVSGTISTPTSGSPALTAGSISSGFGNVCINTTSGTIPTFSITGSDLTTASLSVSANAAYTFATTSGGTYSNPLNLGDNNCSGSNCYSQTIHVKFTPTAVQSYNGDITVSGGGASDATTAVTGSGTGGTVAVTTTTATSITTSGASSGGTSISTTCGTIDDKGVVWGTSANPTVPSANSTDDGSGTADYSSTISGLSSNTEYNYRAYATNSNSVTNYGSNNTFITYPDAPTSLGSGSVTSSGFSVTWTQASGTIENYEVEVHSNSSYTALVGSAYGTANNATSQAATGLSSTTEYWYRVRSRNNSNTQVSAWVDGPSSVTTLMGPCLSQDFASNSLPSGWTQTSITFTSNYAEFAATTGELTTVSVANPTSLDFNLARTTNANLKTLYVEVSTTSQSSGFSIVATYDHSNTTSGATTAINVDLSAYAANSTIYIRFRKASSTTSPWRLDDIAVYCGPPVADINVKGNSVSISDADATPSTTDHTQFTDTEAGLTSTRTFTIENAGSTGTINISSVSVSGTGFSITTNISDNALTTGESTTFVVTFSPNSIAAFTGTITIANDDPDAGEQSYTFAIAGNGTVSLQSTVTAVASSEATTISSIINIASITLNTHGTQAWQFRLYDGNGTDDDGDGLPTIYTALTINQGSGNTVTSWSSAIQDLEFFEGSNSSPIAGTATVGGANIIFTPTTPISASDGAASNKLISIRLSLKNSLPAGSDGLKFVFQLQKSNVSVQSSATSSQLSNFSDKVSDNTKNVIDVTGTALQFISPPTVVNVNNIFTITVAAYDANDNRDLSNTASVTLSKTVGAGTFSVSNATSALSGGTYSWTDAMYNTAEPITLQAAGIGTPVTTNILAQSAPYILFDNFNRIGTTVGSPSSGGIGTWTEDESGTSCSPSNSIIRTSGNALELSNCNQGNTVSCGTSSNKQISFNMTGRYPTIYDNSPEVLEWYVNLSHDRFAASGLSGFASGGYGVAFIIGSTEADFNSGMAQGYALIAGETGTPDPLRLVSFNGQPGNPTYLINSTVDFTDGKKLSVHVTYNPSTDIWSLQVRDDASSFVDPTDMTGYPTALTSSANTTYTNKNLKYYGAFWNHGASCEEILYVDNASIPSVPTVPEIQVTAGPTTGTVNINDADTYDFGPVNVSSGSVTQTFTITNVGLADLLLQSSPNKVVKSGTNSADFTMTQPAASTLAPGASTTFTVTFDPSGAGLRTAILTIDNNDGDEDPFVFNLNGTGATPPVINEFVADHSGTDTNEFIEVFGANSTDYSTMKLIVLEGDAANRGVIDNVISVGTTDAAGYWWTGYLNSQIENGTITILLVMNFSGSLNQDLDTNDDGVLDVTPWTRILDDVALRVSGSDKAYSTTIIVPNFDGTFLTPGGASRIANGIDTDNISNWMRNDIDGWGISGLTGTANANEAKNTPKRVNVRFNVWLGTTTVWTNAANWTVRVPNDTTEALIPTIGSSTYPNITGIVTYDCFGLYLTSTASNITIGAGAEIRNFYDFESLSNSASFGTGIISFEGSAAEKISGTFTIGELLINNLNGVTIQTGSTVNITDKFTLESGQLTNNGSLNLKSTATKTTYIDDFSGAYSGTISGNVTLERYVPSVSSGNIFHYIGSVNNSTAGAKWGDDFSMGVTGTTGFVTPSNCDPASPVLAQGSNYGGFFTYNENNVTDCYLTGWKVESTTYSVTPGKGIAARIANGIILDESGTYPNPVANVTVSNLTKTTANTVAYSRGYNLVANPFYAPLDMTGVITDLVADSDWDGNVYIYDPSSGSYSAYNFLSSNPSTINTNQGFFIRAGNATAQSSTLDFVFNESRRTAASNVTFYRQPQQYAYGLNISVENNGKTDATIIAFDETFTNDFDNGYDAMKLYNDVGIPSLYSKSGNDQQAIHALPLLSDSTRSIPLSILITASGLHTFTFSGIENFPTTSLVWLEDLQMGLFQDLRQNPTYAFTANVNDSNDRFMLHFTAPILTNAVATTCAGSDGEISLQLPAGVEWSFIISNESGAIVARHTGNGGTSVINALPDGNYTITFIHAGNYSVTETIAVAGAQQVDAVFIALSEQVEENEQIQFANTSTGATTYEWDFGDGTTASGISEPVHTYAVEGSYIVTLRAVNADCEDVFTKEITVFKAPTVGVNNPEENTLTVFAHEGNLYVKFDFTRTEVAQIAVNNILGQQIFSDRINTVGLQKIQLPPATAAEYLLISIKTSSEFFVEKIFLPPVE